VGPDAHSVKCVADKNVFIPAGETIGLDRAGDAERFTVSEQGVIVVPEGYRFEP
jgi:glucose-1-phosphate adenylyltransferase